MKRPRREVPHREARDPQLGQFERGYEAPRLLKNGAAGESSLMWSCPSAVYGYRLPSFAKILLQIGNCSNRLSRSTRVASTSRTALDVMVYEACGVEKRATKGCGLPRGDGAPHSEVSLCWQSLWQLCGR
jgi:hypothetical protein